MILAGMIKASKRDDLADDQERGIIRDSEIAL